MPQKFEGIGRNFMLDIEDAVKEKIPKSLRKICNQANEDVTDMIKWRRPAAQIAEEAVIGYMAMAESSKTGRSRFFPPTLHAIVYSRMALEAATIPDVKYKHRRAQSEPLMKFINAAKKNAELGDSSMRPPALFNWYMQNFDKLLFGVGFRYLSYLVQTQVIHVKDEDSGKWKEKTIVVHDDIWDQKLSFFHTGVSRDTLPGMFGGTSAYTDMFMRREQFAARFLKNSNYMNIRLALATIRSEFIRVRLYWNLPGQLFLMQAMPTSGTVLGEQEDLDDVQYGIPIRQSYILDYGPSERAKPFIPITSIHGDFSFDMKGISDVPLFMQGGRAHSDPLSVSRNQTFWTKGDGHLTKGTIALKRMMWRAMADNMKASTVFFAMSQNPGIMSQIKRSDMYGVVPLKADDRTFNVKALLDRPQAMNGFAEWDKSVDDLAVFALGHDWRQSAAQLTNEKATVASIRENMKHVRSQQGQQMNETGGIARHYWCLLQMIQQYYPEKTRIDLADDESIPETTGEQDIIRDEDGLPIGYKKVKKIPYDKMVTVKTDDKGEIMDVQKDEEKGEKFIPGAKKLLVTDEEPEIYIEPGSTFATMKALERALDLERLQHYQPYLQMMYPDAQGQPKPLIPKEGAEYLIKHSAETWEDDPEKIIPTEEHPSDKKPPLHKPFAGSQPPMQQNAPQGAPTVGPIQTQGLPQQIATTQQGNSPQPLNRSGIMPPNSLAASLIPHV